MESISVPLGLPLSQSVLPGRLWRHRRGTQPDPVGRTGTPLLGQSPYDLSGHHRGMKCWRAAAGCGRRIPILQPRARTKSGAGPWGPSTVATSTNRRFRFTPGPLPVASDTVEVNMKQIRDKVAGLDVHRDNVVGCHSGGDARPQYRSAQTTIRNHPSRPGRAERFPHGRRGEHRGNGGDGDLLEAGVLRARRTLR